MDRPFYRGLVTSDDGYQGLVFVSDSLINMMVTNIELHCDGTFKTVPRLFYQLFTVQVKAYGKVNFIKKKKLHLYLYN